MGADETTNSTEKNSDPVGCLVREEDSDEEWCSVTLGGSLIPPKNFGIVEEHLYRSGMPNELNFPFLERLQLKTVLYLATEEIPERMLSFIDDQGIDLVTLVSEDEEVVLQWQPISEDVVLRAMQYFLNPNKYPLYVMCAGGRHRTGTLIGCLRKLQNWCLSSICEEYRRHADAKVRLANEQFIELFDTDLINIPRKPPSWLSWHWSHASSKR